MASYLEGRLAPEAFVSPAQDGQTPYTTDVSDTNPVIQPTRPRRRLRRPRRARRPKRLKAAVMEQAFR